MRTILSLLVAGLMLSATSGHMDPQIYRNRHGQYRVPLGHNRPAVNDIKAGLVWEEQTLECIAGLYRHYVPGTSIVHGGAYFGDMLPFYSQLVGTSGQVLAFEPVSLNYACAVETILLNKLSNVTLLNLALSDQTTGLCMETEQGGVPLGGGSRIVPRQLHSGFEEVKATTLDALLETATDRIGVIHLDVEGHEEAVIRGAMRTIAKDRPLIVVEIWARGTDPAIAQISELGYTLVGTVNRDNHIFYPNEWLVPHSQRNAMEALKMAS
jgi:FkbM family methyltransferase